MKISVQTQPTVNRFGIKDAYRLIREAGFEAIDWGLDQAWKTNEVFNAKEFSGLCIFETNDTEAALRRYSEELNAMKENGLALTQLHTPCPPFTHGRYEVLEYAIRVYRNMIHFSQEVGCPRMVIHALSEVTPPDYRRVISTEECDRLNYHLFESLIPDLQQTDVTVCIENLWVPCYGRSDYDIYDGAFTKPLEANKMIDNLNAKAGKKCFGICLDTGHLHLTRTRFTEYIPIVENRLCALHIHDNMQFNDSHRMPYAGSIRWEEFLSSLKQIGYDGDLNFEICSQVGLIPKELVPSFMRTIYDTGAYFRNYIQGK